jgi:type IV pilus assembly protein PilQ
MKLLESNQAVEKMNQGYPVIKRHTAMKKLLAKQFLVLGLAFLALSFGSLASGASEGFFADGIQVAQESEFPSSETGDGDQSEPAKMKRIIRLTADEADSVVTIEIQGTDKLDYTAFKLMNPLRIVLDMPNMELGDLAAQIIQVDKGVVSTVKPVFFEDTNVLRLEISLNVAASYEISQDVESQVLVKLKNASSEALAMAPSGEEVESQADESADSLVETQTTEEVEPVDEAVTEAVTMADEVVANEEPVNEEIETSEPVENNSDDLEVAQLIDSPEEGAQSADTMDSGENEIQDSQSMDSSDEVETQSENIINASEFAGIDPCSNDDSSEFKRISFDFQNANLKNILRIIAEVAEFNLVLSQDVTGTTNLKMTDVAWNKALNIILSNNGLARECEGQIMRVATEATLEASRVEGILVTEMIRINYADIALLVTSLSGIKSERGFIQTDNRTSTLIITDVQEIIQEMRSVIEKLDKPTQQVTIGMQIVEIETSAAKEFGVGWGVFTDRNTGVDFPSNVSIGSSVTPGTVGANGAGLGILGTNPGDFQVDLADAITPAGSMFFTLATGGMMEVGTTLAAQLRALESRGLSRTLSRPKITTLDNTEARIRKGVRIPLITSTANEGTTVEFVDADLELAVTPHITAEEKIFMKLAATKNSVGAVIGNVGASINTSEATTEMLVNNGSTSVLGGLTSHNNTDGTTAIPFLGDLPWIGWLFRNSINNLTIDELLIFITPTIVRN